MQSRDHIIPSAGAERYPFSVNFVNFVNFVAGGTWVIEFEEGADVVGTDETGRPPWATLAPMLGTFVADNPFP